MGLRKSEHISKIIVHPSNSDVVWVASQGPLWSSGGERGLYKTTDGGKNWKKVLGGGEWTGVTDILIDTLNFKKNSKKFPQIWHIASGNPMTVKDFVISKVNKMNIWDDKFGHQTFRYKKYAYVKNRTGNYVSLYGDKLKTINSWDPEQSDLFESDVNPEIRVLVDNYTDSDDASIGHKVMIFDIEVEVTDGFPNIQKAENKITSIAFNDPILGKYFCYVLDSHNKLSSSNKVDTIVAFKDEYDLLNAFFKKYMEIQPTILTGWNVEFFDVPYLYNRASQVVGHTVANLLSPINIVQWSDFQNRYKIAGVSILDYLALYKKYTFSQRPSYRLDAIGEYEVGEKKVEYEGTLNDLYENDLNKFVEYNLQDVKLVKKIDDKLNFIEISRGLAHLGHCPYEDVFMSSRYLE